MDFTQVLAHVEKSRLLKATEGLVTGSYSVQIHKQDAWAVSGHVTNGDSKTYAVTVGGEDFTACSCPDFRYRAKARGYVCKHVVVLALHAIRQPHTRQVECPIGKVTYPFITL